MRRTALSASTVRDIVRMEVQKRGPLSVSEMYSELRTVFPRTDFRIFASALMARRSGLCVINGVIDTIGDAPVPIARHEFRKVKAIKGRKYVTR